MGCCLSKATTQNKHNALKNHQPQVKPSLPKSNRTHEEAPPPPPPAAALEEESVKEVLSETTISKPQQVPILKPETKTHLPLVRNPDVKFEKKVPLDEVSEVVSSQVSEACSFTESFSTATTATTTGATIPMTEKREDEATSKHVTTTHKWNRSPSRKRPHAADGNVQGVRERRVKSPARRPEPSPEKKVKTGSRVVRGRESGTVANRKLNAGPAGVRRDSGEVSGRRSRSPSVGRTSKVVAGGGRKQVPPATNGVVEKEKKSESEEVKEKNDDENDVVPQEESLENPHVSMECFIFL